MSIEQVRCENCGSGDVRQLAPDSYRCDHCHTEFRWVDPTKITVAHKPGVCACGNVAVAYCVRCHEPLCKIHKKRWIREWEPEGWDDKVGVLHGNFVCDLLELEIDLEDGKDHDHDEFVQPILRAIKEHALPAPEDNVVLCAKCQVECSKTYRAILEGLVQAEQQGRACGACFSDHVVGRCVICGKGMCLKHRTTCERCHQSVCNAHVANGRLCTKCGTPHQRAKTSQASPWLGRLWKWLGLQK
jgi:hypothetical protein